MVDSDGAGSGASHTDSQRAQDMFRAASAIVGDRLGSWGADPDGYVSFTVVDLTDDDVGNLRDAAVQVGLAGRVRLERPDEAVLAAWDGLRHDLDALADQRPHVLMMWPQTGTRYHRGPVHIHLDASAPGVAAAAQLHDRYGDFVALRVGALRYPPDPEQGRALSLRESRSRRDLVDPEEMTFSLDGTLSVRSGESATHMLVLLNTSNHAITVETTGQLTGVVVDPKTGRTVGGVTGPATQPLIPFTAHPRQTVAIPLLVGTASFEPDLGYTVPAGAWQLFAALNLQDGRRLETPALELTITD